MARRRTSRRKPYNNSRPAEQPKAQAAPAQSGAMAALSAQVEEIDRRDKFRQKDFEMKPRAVRKFERYAGMGEE